MTEVPVKVEKMIFCPMSRLQVKLNHELRDYVTAEVSDYRNTDVCDLGLFIMSYYCYYCFPSETSDA